MAMEMHGIHRVAIRPELSLDFFQVWQTSRLFIARTPSSDLVVESHVTDFSTCGGVATPDQRCRYCMLGDLLCLSQGQGDCK
jgi:hypothetical protein